MDGRLVSALMQVKPKILERLKTIKEYDGEQLPPEAWEQSFYRTIAGKPPLTTQDNIMKTTLEEAEEQLKNLGAFK